MKDKKTAEEFLKHNGFDHYYHWTEVVTMLNKFASQEVEELKEENAKLKEALKELLSIVINKTYSLNLTGSETRRKLAYQETIDKARKLLDSRI